MPKDTKVCRKCRETKPLSEYYKDTPTHRTPDGFNNYCKSCVAEWKRSYRARVRAADDRTCTCIMCGEGFEPFKRRGKYCPECRAWIKTHRTEEELQRSNARLAGRPTEKKLFDAARRRAKRDGYPFTLELSDIIIPEFCPILGVRLVPGNRKGPRPDAPSLDKITPELGYVPGNIQVISHKANSMKHNASREELISFAEWVMKEVVRKNG